MILYPVTVTVPATDDGPAVEHRPAKVYAHEGVTQVFMWNAATHDADMVLEVPGEPEPNGFRQHIVGDVTIAATGGCGCGHPLRRWSPPRPVIG